MGFRVKLQRMKLVDSAFYKCTIGQAGKERKDGKLLVGMVYEFFVIFMLSNRILHIDKQLRSQTIKPDQRVFEECGRIGDMKLTTSFPHTEVVIRN